MKKKTFTLLEILIVIFLITLITGAIGYNMKGTLDRGRAFRTEQAIAELHDLLLVCVSEGKTFDQVRQDPVGCLKSTGLAKNPEKLVRDGWDKNFEIRLSRSRDDFKIHSAALINYYKKTGRHETVQQMEEE